MRAWAEVLTSLSVTGKFISLLCAAEAKKKKNRFMQTSITNTVPTPALNHINKHAVIRNSYNMKT